ncbi:MAG TPA: hypothetical protein VIA82_00075 [Candidatus Limnocylindria bacterium]|jgi:hypothetical protein
MSPMEQQLLAQALSMAGLALGTLGYALILRRRRDQRREAAQSATTGLRGLVRVMFDGYVPE